QLRSPQSPQEEYVRSLAFSADSRTLVSVHHEGALHFWEVPEGKRSRTVQLSDPDRPNRGFVQLKYCFLSADGRALATLSRSFGSEGNAISNLDTWDAQTGQLRTRHAFPLAGSCAWVPDGRAVSFTTGEQLLHMDTGSGRIRFQVAHSGNGPLAASAD